MTRTKNKNAYNFGSARMHRKRSSEAMGALYEDVEKFFGDIFAHYARILVRLPVVFLVVPMIICLLLGLGLLKSDTDLNTEWLYTPSDSETRQNQHNLSLLFHEDYINQLHYYQTLFRFQFGEVIVLCNKDNEGSICLDNIVTNESVSEIISLYNSIVDLTNCSHGFDTYDRMSNAIEKFQQYIQENDTLCIKQNDVQFKPIQFRNVSYDANDCLHASALKLKFYANSNDTLFEKKFSALMTSLQLNSIQIVWRVSQSLDWSLNKEVLKDEPLFLYAVVIMLVYATIIGAGINWVSNHVTLAYAGVFATLMSILAAFGLLSLCGVPIVSMSGLMPFLILGIGADDMFHLMTEWRQTCTAQPLEFRLAATLRGAAVSITITSLVELIAFCIGATSPFPSVKNFCALSGVAIFFCYFNQMTFFCGYLVLNARRINSSRHCVTCLPVTSYRDMQQNDRSVCCIVMCCGSPPKKSVGEGGICKPLSKAFYNVYPKFLLHWITKSIVITVFAVYLCLSLWGMTQVKKGFSFNDIVPKGSELELFTGVDAKYYPTDGPVVMLAVTEPLNYFKTTTRAQITNILAQLERNPFVNSNETISWISEFENCFLVKTKQKCGSPKEFVNCIQDEFLPTNTKFYNDIIIDKRSGEIIASRYYLKLHRLKDSDQEAHVLRTIRGTLKNTTLPVSMFNHELLYFEHYDTIVKDTVLVTGVTMVGLLFVALVFIPHPIVITCVTVSMLSVAIGMVACMALANLELSAFTTIQIVLSVAFCTDSTVHMSHAFMTATMRNRNQRVSVAIATVGTSILNCSASALLAFVILSAANSYIFVCFWKSMVIVVLLVFIHSMVFLPVFLSFIGPRHTSPPRVFIPVSNSARSLQDTYRANSLTRPTDKDIERFNAERQARLQQLQEQNASKILRTQSAVQLGTSLDDDAVADDDDNDEIGRTRRVSFAISENTLSIPSTSTSQGHSGSCEVQLIIVNEPCNQSTLSPKIQWLSTEPPKHSFTIGPAK